MRWGSSATRGQHQHTAEAYSPGCGVGKHSTRCGRPGARHLAGCQVWGRREMGWGTGHPSPCSYEVYILLEETKRTLKHITIGGSFK